MNNEVQELNSSLAEKIDPENEDIQNSWVLFLLADRSFGLRTAQVLEMVNVPEISELPDHPPFIRGVINLRGQVMPVVDLRMRLGMERLGKQTEELVELLTAREQDHVEWLAELEASVKEEREFTLTTDPHACKFGKWYDSFKTDNHLLRNQLKKFDGPHKRIHAVAERVKKLEHDGKTDEALKTVSNARDVELATMKKLFSDTREILTETIREIVIVSKVEGENVGFIVDAVTEVRDVDPEKITDSTSKELKIDNRFTMGIAEVEDRLVILLDAESLY
jgi:purine-binding chemotaxis protein CheW